MSYLPLPRTMGRGRVPCLRGRTAQLPLLLLGAAVAIVGNIGLAQHLTAITKSGTPPQPMPGREPTFAAEVAPLPVVRRLATRSPTHPEEGARIRSKKLETAVESRVVPEDWLRQDAGEGHRKLKKENGGHHSKKNISRRGRGDDEERSKSSKAGRKSRRAEGVKEGKREAKHEKHERKKSKALSKREKSKGRDKRQSKGKKEGKVKEKKKKEEKAKSKHRKTTATPSKREKKPTKRVAPAVSPAAPPLPAAPSAGAMPPVHGEIPKPGVGPTPETKQLPVAEDKAISEAPVSVTDRTKPGIPAVPTIAFVGKRVRKAPPSRLQQDLDALCTKHFRTLCRAQDGHGPFCHATTAVARLSMDENSADGRGQWRCYDGSIAETEEKGMRCVDECGGQIRCAGNLEKRRITSEPLSELSKFVDRRKWIYCSSFQYAANALCNFKKAGNVARYDPHRARWMCLDPVDIAMDSTGYCADNCGGTIPCAGGVIPGETPARTVYIVHSDNIVEAFAALQPCKGPDETCVATVLNPPKCVAAGLSGAILKLSHQQAAMNKLCQREVDALCRAGKWNQHCFELWLARKHTTGLACFPREGLDFTGLSRCFDGCKEAPCPGSPFSPEVPRVVLRDLTEIAQNPFYCSPFQAAGNKYCAVHKGPGYVARQHNVTREWQCFRNDELPPKGWTGCANNCGAFTACASGSVNADPTVQEDHELENTIRSTPAPCLSGEECEATPQNPPYCSQTRPNPQPVAPPPGELQKELGCVDVALENAKTEGSLAAYGPAAHISTLAWIRSKTQQ